MKKHLLIISGLLVLNSCATDPLDLAPVSEIGANGFYTNDEEMELATVAIYDGLQAIPKIEFAVTEMRSDNSKTKPVKVSGQNLRVTLCKRRTSKLHFIGRRITMLFSVQTESWNI